MKSNRFKEREGSRRSRDDDDDRPRGRRSRSRFSNMDETDASGDKKPWAEPGRYKVRVEKVNCRDGRKNELWFIVEFTLLKVYSTEDKRKMKKGKVYAQVFDYNEDMGPINAKRFILAANGLDPSAPENNDKVGEEETETAVSDEQPLAGTILELQCDAITTRGGNPFTKYTWIPVDEDSEDDEEDSEDDEDEDEDDEDEDEDDEDEDEDDEDEEEEERPKKKKAANAKSSSGVKKKRRW